MKLKDPKFGYHWVWMIPVFWVLFIYTNVIDWGKRFAKWISIRYSIRRNPEIKKIVKLSRSIDKK